jgi:hypothetical protein
MSVGWLGVSLISAKAWRRVVPILAMIDSSPELAEQEIASSLRRRPLHKPVRLMLYHRLAVLRHRQEQFSEVAAICRAVLARRSGAVKQVQAHLLLMMTESHLAINDLWGAYQALSELWRLPLGLTESLQRLALQTRYLVECGYDQHALEGLERKVPLIELMPAAQCGALHAILALAARRAQRHTLSEWLWRRAQLLCTPEQLAQLTAGVFGPVVPVPAAPAHPGG